MNRRSWHADGMTWLQVRRAVPLMILLWWLLASPCTAAPDGAALYARCSGCHGADGSGDVKRGAPNLTGQDASYIARQLTAFVRKERGATTDDPFARQMSAAVEGLPSTDGERIAAYVAGLPPKRSAAVQGSLKPLDARTAQSYFNGICSACHASDGAGNVPLHAPRLAGQDPAYLARQYEHFKAGSRGTAKDDLYGTQMRAMVKALPDRATEAVVLSYAAALGGAH